MVEAPLLSRYLVFVIMRCVNVCESNSQRCRNGISRCGVRAVVLKLVEVQNSEFEAIHSSSSQKLVQENHRNWPWSDEYPPVPRAARGIPTPLFSVMVGSGSTSESVPATAIEMQMLITATETALDGRSDMFCVARCDTRQRWLNKIESAG